MSVLMIIFAVAVFEVVLAVSIGAMFSRAEPATPRRYSLANLPVAAHHLEQPATVSS